MKNKAIIFPTNGVRTTVVCETPDEIAKGEYLKLWKKNVLVF